MKYNISLFVALAFLSASCSSSIPTIQKPNSVTPAQPSPPEESNVMIPLNMDLTPSYADMETSVPSFIDAMGAISYDGDAGVKYRIWRGTMGKQLNGNLFSLTLPISYHVEGFKRTKKPWPLSGYLNVYVGGCGDENNPASAVHANIPISSTLSLLPDYSVASSSSIGNISGDRCNVTIFNIDVTDKVNGAIRKAVGDKLGQVDSRIHSVLNFKSKAQDAWNHLSSPIKISDSIYLIINPKEFRVSAINGSGSQASTSIGLASFPELKYGASEPVTSQTPLPDLKVTSPGNSFHIALESILTFKDANDVLVRNLVGREYPFIVLGKTVHEKIVSAQMYGAGAIAVLQIELKGDVKGTIYFTGHPFYDAISNSLSVPDLDYSTETANILANVADWLLHSGFRDNLRTEAKWDISSAVTKAKSEINVAINKQVTPQLKLTGSLNGLRSDGVETSATGFTARIIADGILQADITP